MKQKITKLRIKIDGLSQLVKELKPIYIPGQRHPKKGLDGKKSWKSSDELNKSYDSLILAKAWLGKVLGELGQETPYKNDGNRKTVDQIEKTADTVEVFNVDVISGIHWNDTTHIEKVDWLRQEIKSIFDELHNTGFYKIYFTDDQMGDNYCNNFYQHLSEARFWMGFELSRCRDEKTEG